MRLPLACGLCLLPGVAQVSDVGVADIIEALRAEVTEDGNILLDRLEAELNLTYWPQGVWETALDIFGPAVYSREGRTYKALDRRIRHALRTWDGQHGPLTAEQNEYAAEVLQSALRKAQKDARGVRGKLWPFAQAQIGRMVMHERVHEGFRSRAGFVAVKDQLEKALA
jgi:hypothetical protein